MVISRTLERSQDQNKKKAIGMEFFFYNTGLLLSYFEKKIYN